jgi:hypothetical protein
MSLEETANQVCERLDCASRGSKISVKMRTPPPFLSKSDGKVKWRQIFEKVMSKTLMKKEMKKHFKLLITAKVSNTAIYNNEQNDD